ncbi:MAG: phosphatidate cytidylyltransferase [Ruthenibacterium sp.]
MKTRLITSAVGIAILFVVMFFFDTILFDLIIAAICLIAIHEIFKALKFDKAPYIYWGFVIYTLLIMLSNFHLARVWILPASYLFALYLAICVILNFKSINFAKLGGMTLFSGIVIFCFYSFIYLKRLLPQENYNYDAIYFIFLILGVAWGGDSAAYFAGRMFGKHKLAPIVSPNKTVEGAIGGVLGSMLLGVLVTAVYAGLYGKLVGIPMTKLGINYYIAIALLAGIGSGLGMLGDLFASAVKRQCEIKDYGTIFPGHGGILDRFDSVMFVAPFVSIVVTMVFYYFTHPAGL